MLGGVIIIKKYKFDKYKKSINIKIIDKNNKKNV